MTFRTWGTQVKIWRREQGLQVPGTFEFVRLDFLLLVAYFTFFYAATWRISVGAVHNHSKALHRRS